MDREVHSVVSHEPPIPGLSYSMRHASQTEFTALDLLRSYLELRAARTSASRLE